MQSIWLGTATVTVTANAERDGNGIDIRYCDDTLGTSATLAAFAYFRCARRHEDSNRADFRRGRSRRTKTPGTIIRNYFFSSSTGGRIGDGGLDVTKVDGGLEITANETGTASVEVFALVHSYALKVTVKQNPHSLEVSPDSASLAVGGTATLTSRVKDSNGHDIQLASGDQEGLVVSWATSNPGVATVDGADGSTEAETGASATVAAVAAGMATIHGALGHKTLTGNGHDNGDGLNGSRRLGREPRSADRSS